MEDIKTSGKTSVGRSAAALAAIGMVAKLVGALYRVPLTNTVGAEGMGLYQMVFPLYTVLLAFCGGGMTSAVARYVAKHTARGEEGACAAVLRAAIVPLIIVSAAAAGGVAIFRNAIAGVQGNARAGLCYLAICPSLLFASGIGVLRGYFQGKSLMLPGGISQLIEQLVKLFLGLFLAKSLLRYGLEYAVAGALAGVSAGELCALIYLVARFVLYKGKAKRCATNVEAAAELCSAPGYPQKASVRELYGFAFSVMLGSLVLPLTQMIDSALVINLLVAGGAERSEATALYGLVVGPVGTLVNMPTVIALSVSTAFLPVITARIESGGDVQGAARAAAGWIMLFVIPVTAAFLLFPKGICAALYSGGLSAEELDIAARLLRVSAPSVFYIGVLQLCTAVLHGCGRAKIPVCGLAAGACVKLALTPILVRSVGITGAAAATAACYGVAALLCARSAAARVPVALPASAVIKPLVCTVPAGGAYILCNAIPAVSGLAPLPGAVVCGLAFAALYLAAAAALGAVNVRSTLRGGAAKKILK